MPRQRTIGIWMCASFILGCGANGGKFAGLGAEEEGPFGPPSASALLSPLEGGWVFDMEKTLDAQNDGGVSDEQVAILRKLYAGNPSRSNRVASPAEVELLSKLADESLLGAMHPDITISGNDAVANCFPVSEYRFFAMHEHDGKICGKAWHHEDRYDPGDMQKCYARLKLDDNLLYLEIKMKDGLSDLNDPDLLSPSLPAEGGSAATCDADAPSGSDWSGWTTYVFARK